jgi:hypothetical protein
MEYLRKIIASDELCDIFDLPLTLRNTRVDVIILPAQNNIAKTPKMKRELGFVKLPPLPESFFDPLSEEDLQAWGL